MERLDRLIAHNLGMSRSRATALFRAGRVTDVAGEALAASDAVSPPIAVVLDGVEHTLYDRVDILMHKPLGYITAHRDLQHPVAHALMVGAPLHGDLRAIGRLDKETSGLLLWTTDGGLLHRWTHPKHRVKRTYQAAVAGPWREPPASVTLDDGHVTEILDLHRLSRDECHPALVVPPGCVDFASITIASGVFHEVRRVFEVLGTEVVGLARVSYGPIVLPPELAAGAWRVQSLVSEL